MRRTCGYAAMTKDAAQRSIRTFYEVVNKGAIMTGKTRHLALASLLTILFLPGNLAGADPFSPNDPYFFYNNSDAMKNFPGQWHLENNAPATLIFTDARGNQYTMTNSGFSAGLRGAWNQGYTGKGVVIGVIDDGVDGNNEDIKPNYNAALSKNFSDNETMSNSAQGPKGFKDSHGTAVAGVAAARGGNGIGGTGVAPFAELAGLRVNFSSPGTAADPKATPGNYYDAYYWKSGVNPDTGAIERTPEIQVKNHSYGPDDPFEYDSFWFPKLKSALENTAANGVIHVVSAGNARGEKCEDSNKIDALSSSGVIVVAALGSDGKYADYSSYGANVFVTAPSNRTDNYSGFGITTTDRSGDHYGYNRYSLSGNPSGDRDENFPNTDYASLFGGTSSSAPLVSGIMALGKEVNPLMTVRMAKYALTLSSSVVDSDHADWNTNGAGLKFNPNYGFGNIDAGQFTDRINKTAYVTQQIAHNTGTVAVNQTIPDNDESGVNKTFNLTADHLAQSLEGIEVTLGFSHQKRGDLAATLLSPSGMRSILLYSTKDLALAQQDKAAVTDFSWTFLTNAFWGETGIGEWALTMADLAPQNTGIWTSYQIAFRMGKMEVQQDLSLTGHIRAESLTINAGNNFTYTIPAGSGNIFEARDGVRIMAGALAVNGSLIINGFDSTIAGAFTGTGSMQYNGQGIFSFNGDGSGFTGTGTISSGEMALAGAGAFGGDLQIGSGGALNGTGTVAKRLTNQGTVAPGASIGTLTVNGDYTQTQSGKLKIEVASPASNDLLNIGGSASIDGTLETLWQGGAVPANKTVFGTILSAAGVSGTFSSLNTKITPTLYFKPRYDRATEIYLMTERDYAAGDLFSSLTGNQRSVSRMLNPLANSASGDLNTVLGRIDALTTNAQVGAAFDQLSPIAGVAHTVMTSGAASFQTGNASSRLGDLRLGVRGFSSHGLENVAFLSAQSYRQPFHLAGSSDDLRGMIPAASDPRWGLFVRGNLALGDQKDTLGQRGYNFKNGGLTVGTDYRFSEHFIGGALFGMNTAQAWINDAGSTVKLDGYTLGIYGTYFRKAFYIDAQAGYGWNSFTNSRRIVFPGIDRTAAASPSGDQVTAYGGTGYDFRFGPLTIGPALTFQYLWMGMGGYTESGADSLNLRVDRQTTESYQGSAGIKGAWNWTKDELRIVPRLWGFYRHEFGNVNPATIASLARGSSAFTIESVAPERNFFNLGAGVNVYWTDRFLIYLSYEAQLGQSAYSAQNITLGVRLEW
ncbi:MAG: hypothetical protein C0394_09500 [Syntrophus sp. (in: bacteria)]|nr:hypothetical protein [Syntrophus sp. (in: bacteria)]